MNKAGRGASSIQPITSDLNLLRRTKRRVGQLNRSSAEKLRGPFLQKGRYAFVSVMG
jgi:hypothetical protein